MLLVVYIILGKCSKSDSGIDSSPGIISPLKSRRDSAVGGGVSQERSGTCTHHGEAGVLDLDHVLAGTALEVAVLERVALDDVVAVLEHPLGEAADSVVQARSPQLKHETILVTTQIKGCLLPAFGFLEGGREIIHKRYSWNRRK